MCAPDLLYMLMCKDVLRAITLVVRTKRAVSKLHVRLLSIRNAAYRAFVDMPLKIGTLSRLMNCILKGCAALTICCAALEDFDDILVKEQKIVKNRRKRHKIIGECSNFQHRQYEEQHRLNNRDILDFNRYDEEQHNFLLGEQRGISEKQREVKVICRAGSARQPAVNHRRYHADKVENVEF